MGELPIIFPINRLIAMGIPHYVAFSWVAIAFIIILSLICEKIHESRSFRGTECGRSYCGICP